MFLSVFYFRDNQPWQYSNLRMGCTKLHSSECLEVNKTDNFSATYTEARSPNHCNCGTAIRLCILPVCSLP